MNLSFSLPEINSATAINLLSGETIRLNGSELPLQLPAYACFWLSFC
jgi:hypothetical protein